MAKRKKPLPDDPRVPPDPVAPAAPQPGLMPLSDEERRFIAEWTIDRNSYQAYLRLHPGTGAQLAVIRTREMISRPQVRAEMRAIKRSQSVRARVDAELTLEELAYVAFSDVYHLFDPTNNSWRAPGQIPMETRKAIASIKVSRQRVTRTTDGTTQVTVVDTVMEYKLWPKLDALKRLCEFLGLSTSLPPLDALMAALPSSLADSVRTELSRRGTDGSDGQLLPQPTQPPKQE